MMRTGALCVTMNGSRNVDDLALMEYLLVSFTQHSTSVPWWIDADCVES